MQSQEKKYVVDSIEPFEERLVALGAGFLKQSASDHYYTKQASKDVVKLVVSKDKCEIHKLSEADGQFTLTDRIACRDVHDGLQQLKDMGYDEFSIVRMEHRDYSLNGGTIGLYTIDNTVHSVILDYLSGQHNETAKLLALDDSQTLTIPYNVYLDQIGRLRQCLK